MKTVAITTALMAAGALAAPNTAARNARHLARAAATKETADITYSSSWSGVALSQSGFTSVEATVVVPAPKGNSSASAAAWVGIDGASCNKAILQTGIDFSINDAGEAVYGAWYEWWPSLAFDFTDFVFTAGDEIKMKVVADSGLQSGVATLENLSTGSSVNHTFVTYGTVQLCGWDAEWIVEDYEFGFGQVPFVNFDSVTFSNATAIQNGTAVGPTGATIYDLQQNGEILTDCGFTESTVFCNYV